MIRIALLVMAGSGIGGAARYLVQQFFQKNATSSFPWGTLLVNILGCLIIGLVWSLVEKNKIPSTEFATFLMAGFCGGFTTFSALTLDNYLLFQNGQYLQAFLYSTISLVAGYLFFFAGMYLTK